MPEITQILKDGGVFITYPILILLVTIVILFIRGLKKNDLLKTKELIASIGWFVIAWGYLGRTIGLIKAFDNVAAAGDVAPSLLSGGLKMALIGPLLAWLTFIVARAFIIILIVKNKKYQQS